MSRDAEAIAVRRAEALTYRLAGASYRKIAKQLNVSVETAYNDVQAELRALRTLTAKDAEELRELELFRLDEWALSLAQAQKAGDPRAIQTLIRIQERRAKLLGLDAPVRTQHEGTLTVDVTGARERFARTLAQLAARSARRLPEGPQ